MEKLVVKNCCCGCGRSEKTFRVGAIVIAVFILIITTIHIIVNIYDLSSTEYKDPIHSIYVTCMGLMAPVYFACSIVQIIGAVRRSKLLICIALILMGSRLIGWIFVTIIFLPELDTDEMLTMIFYSASNIDVNFSNIL